MAIGKAYPQDNKIVDADLFLGTKSSSLATVNYTAQSVADYLNNQGKISIGGQTTFKFVVVNPVIGTISFPNGGGDNTDFSLVTNLIVSIIDMSNQNVVDFIDYIIGSEILLTEQNQVSIFGNYKIITYSVTSNPNFYDLSLEYIGGYGSLHKDLYYDLSFFRDSTVIPPVVTPSLNEVLTVGNTSLLDAKIGELYLYDTSNQDYGKIQLSDSEYNFYNTSGDIISTISNVGAIFRASLYYGFLNVPTTLTANRTYEFPNASGTIALTSDLTPYLLSTTAASTYYPIPTGTISEYIRGDGTFATFPTIPTVGTWGTLNYPAWTTGTPFVKMTAVGTFALDTNTYLTGITSSDVTTALGYTPVTNARTLTINGVGYDLTTDRSWTIPTNAGTVTSVGLSMPPAFTVSSSPITSAGTIAVSAAGTSAQYIRGDGQLATLPSGGGGGASVFYYLNGSIAASVATYKQLSNTAVIGTGTDFAITGNGLITQFLTDVGNPNRLQIPSGAWNFEMFFSMSSSGGTPKFYVELLKYNGATFTTIADNSAAPETISGGTSIDLYLSSLAVPETTLLLTDRLVIRVYIVNSTGGRTATLHTEDNHLCQITTTFASGISAINGLNSNNQYLSIGTSGTDFNISSVSETHTFNLPTASATNRGALSTTDWSAFNAKQNALTNPITGTGTTNYLPKFTGASTLGDSAAQDNGTSIIIEKAISNSSAAPLMTRNLTPYSAPNYNQFSQIWLNSGGGIMAYIRNDGTFLTTNEVKSNYHQASIAGSATAPVFFAGSGGLFFPSLTDIAFTTASTERMRINAAGNVGIGTSAPTGGKLHLQGTSGAPSLYIKQGGDAAGDGLMMYGATSASSARMYVDSGGNWNFNRGGTDILSIRPSFNNVGIGIAYPAASAKLDVTSTTQGFLPPRMTNAQRIAIATPAVGLCVYCTDTVEGLYINKSTGWTYIG